MSKCLNLVGESSISIIQWKVMPYRVLGLQKMWLNTMFNPSLYILNSLYPYIDRPLDLKRVCSF